VCYADIEGAVWVCALLPASILEKAAALAMSRACVCVCPCCDRLVDMTQSSEYTPALVCLLARDMGDTTQGI
jgi:hypothetical protein